VTLNIITPDPKFETKESSQQNHAIVLSNKITFPFMVLEETWFLLPLQPMIGTDCIGINFWSQGHWFQILCGPKMKVRSNGKFLNIISEEPGMEMQLYFAKFESGLQQVGDFLQFPPPIKLTVTIN
jgi:hypothetical protein